MKSHKLHISEFQFDSVIDCGGCEDVTCQITAWYEPGLKGTWTDPPSGESADIIECWIDISDDGDHPENIVDKLDNLTMARFEEEAIAEAHRIGEEARDAEENNAFDRFQDR